MKRIIRGLLYLIRNIVLKIKFGNLLKYNGLLRVQRDTNLRIDKNSEMLLDSSLAIDKGVHFSAVGGGTLMIDKNCFFNRYCIVMSRKKIQIGDHCIFGPNVCIYDHDHKFDYDGVKEEFNLGDVIIENGCWIGANVTILRNTHIGEKSVIGAGCVVQGDIPSHSLVIMNRNTQITKINRKE